MNSNNNKIKNLTGFLILVSISTSVIFLSFTPRQARAVGPVMDVATEVSTGLTAGSTGTSAAANTTSVAIQIKNVAKEIGKQILMTIAQKALQSITNSTINWINTGFHGNPLFIENPTSFFTDIAKTEIKNIVDTYGYDPARFPFGKDFALNVINSYKTQADTNAAYTLSEVMKDKTTLNNYQNNFSAGGWNGFLVNTQYSQNNYPGFTMIATQKLANKLNGTVQNAAEKVKATVAQGQGFLSPQTCPSNPKYNNLKNEFKQPSFDLAAYTQTNPFHPPTDPSLSGTYIAVWTERLNSAKKIWADQNACPGGLVATTPGKIVGDKITKALGMPEDGTLQAMGVGNSISAVLDSLLNHFLDKGLNALTSKINPAAPKDTWTYDGQSLGSPAGVNTGWNSGPDAPIILADFKKAVQEGITNTQTELALMDNANSTKPGVVQLFTSIWMKTRELDICQPGPDMGWETRTDDEEQRNGMKFSERLSDSDGNIAAEAKAVQSELTFAVTFLKDWINNQMMTALPNSVMYMDSINQLPTLQDKADELITAERLKKQALARLKSIQTILNTITTQPATGSAKEKIMMELRVQYNATENDISNTTTIANRQDQLNKANEQFIKLSAQKNECNTERKAGGWSVPANGNYSNFNGAGSTFNGQVKAACTENASMKITKSLPSTMIPGQKYNITIEITNTGESYWYNSDVIQLVKKYGNLDISSDFTTSPSPEAPNNSLDLTYSVIAPSKPANTFDEVTYNIDQQQAKEMAKNDALKMGYTFNEVAYDAAQQIAKAKAKNDALALPGSYSLEIQMVHNAGNPYMKLTDANTNPPTTDTCGNAIPSLDTYFGDIGTFSMTVAGTKIQDVVSKITPDPNPDLITAVPPSPSGAEGYLFCSGPIAGGYDHGGFKHSEDTGGHGMSGSSGGGNGRVTYPDIPYVNADNVMKWRTFGSVMGAIGSRILSVFSGAGSDTFHHVDIRLDCGLIYKANVMDYKGNLPGGTPVLDTYRDTYAVNADECTPTPTQDERQEAQTAVDWLKTRLNDPTYVPTMRPIVTPAPEDYQAAVQQVIADANIQFPGALASYYPEANDIGMRFNYIIGPATIVDSNQIGIGDTWRDAWRVNCPVEAGTCTAVPDPTKHSDPGIEAAMDQARSALRGAGMTWIPPFVVDEKNPTPAETVEIHKFECNRFELLKRTAKILETAASSGSPENIPGIYKKDYGNNCEGYSVDIIAFPDGYLYDAIGGTAPGVDGAPSSWGDASCAPVDASRYKKASEIPNTSY